MPTQVIIEAGNARARAELSDSDCARRIAGLLPVEGTARVWGEEIYFPIGLGAPAGADARQSFAFGEIGYGPVSDAICLFLGPTPMSGPNESCPANPVNPIGRFVDDYQAFKEIAGGEKVVVRAE